MDNQPIAVKPATTRQADGKREVTREELAASLPLWALELAYRAVKVRATKRHCTLITRFDGLAFQISEAEPVARVVVE